MEMAWLAVAAFALNVLLVAVGGTWKISKVRDEIKDEINKHRQESDARDDMIRREFGEVAAAIRQKVADTELWNRDNFLRKESFYESIKQMGDRIDNRMQRFENKIDAMQVMHNDRS